MAKIGGRKRLVRLEVPWAPAVKKVRFVTRPRGSHPLGRSLPLLLIIREVLGLAETAREAKKIIKGRNVSVDGKVVTDPKRGAGLFDAISVGGKSWRLVPRRAKLVLVEIGREELNKKICQITGKTAVKNGKIQLGLHDGKSVLVDKTEDRVGDSLLVMLPEQKIEETFRLEPGVMALVTAGTNAGRIAKVRSVEKGFLQRVWLLSGSEAFEAPLKAVIPVGSEKPAITVS